MSVTGKKIKLVEFREAVIEGLLRNKTIISTDNEDKNTLEKTSKIGSCK